MAKGWIGLALASLLVAAVPAWGQYPPYPSPYPPSFPYPSPSPFPGPRGEPMPISPSAFPIPPSAFPQLGDKKNIPPPDPPPETPFSYRADDLNAFARDIRPECDTSWYFYIGAMALMRNNLGRGVVAYQDPFGNPDTNNIPQPTDPVNVDFITFVQPVNVNYLVDNDRIVLQYIWGVRGTIGYRFWSDAVEFSGFYLPPRVTRFHFESLGRINTLFGIFPNLPLGFQGGSSNLFLQADQVMTEFTTTIGNAEGNYRWSTGVGADVLVGLRYFDLREKLSIFIDDDGLTLLNAGQTRDPLRQVTYSVQSHNRILGPQIGFETEEVIFKGLAGGLFGKFLIGANFVDVVGRLERGDGFMAPQLKNQTIQFSSVLEFGGFLDVLFTERLRLRLGYQLLWAFNVPEAHAQVNFDLGTSLLNPNPNGDILYHGPIFELQMEF